MCRPKERLPPVKCNQAISCGFLRMLTPYFCLLRVSCFTNVGKQQPDEHFFGQIFPFSAFQSRKKPLENGFPFQFAAAVCCCTRISVIQIVHRTQSLELSQRSQRGLNFKSKSLWEMTRGQYILFLRSIQMQVMTSVMPRKVRWEMTRRRICDEVHMKDLDFLPFFPVNWTAWRSGLTRCFLRNVCGVKGDNLDNWTNASLNHNFEGYCSGIVQAFWMIQIVLIYPMQ